MKIKTAVFALSAPGLTSCPKSALPEFAFIGRSNVGKSSLINMLAERRELALVSDTPGKTKLINFFLINECWHLIDLPGYGYAHGSHKARDDFAKASSDYLTQRRNIYCVFVLIDSRLEPQRIDLEFVNWIASCAVPFVLIFTKTDKQSATATKTSVTLFTQALTDVGVAVPEIFISSSKTKRGRTEILGFIEQTLTDRKRAVVTARA